MNDERRLLPVSRVQDNGVALSLPALVSAKGASQVTAPAMDLAERAALVASSDLLDRAFGSLAG